MPLAKSAVADVKRALREAHLRWTKDVKAGIRVTGIDGALARKLPNASREWSWYYVFPATRHSSMRRRLPGGTIFTKQRFSAQFMTHRAGAKSGNV